MDELRSNFVKRTSNLTSYSVKFCQNNVKFEVNDSMQDENNVINDVLASNLETIQQNLLDFLSNYKIRVNLFNPYNREAMTQSRLKLIFVIAIDIAI
jgi:vacuolar-type H+-ATPase subunit D/Vma8